MTLSNDDEIVFTGTWKAAAGTGSRGGWSSSRQNNIDVDVDVELQIDCWAALLIFLTPTPADIDAV